MSASTVVAELVTDLAELVGEPDHDLALLLAEVADLVPAEGPLPGGELAVLLSGRSTTGAAPAARRRRTVLVGVAASVATVVSLTSAAAVANELPAPVQRIVAHFSERYLPVTVPRPVGDRPAPGSHAPGTTPVETPSRTPASTPSGTQRRSETDPSRRHRPSTDPAPSARQAPTTTARPTGAARPTAAATPSPSAAPPPVVGGTLLEVPATPVPRLGDSNGHRQHGHGSGQSPEPTLVGGLLGGVADSLASAQAPADDPAPSTGSGNVPRRDGTPTAPVLGGDTILGCLPLCPGSGAASRPSSGVPTPASRP